MAFMSLIENIVENIVDRIFVKISNNVFKDRVLPAKGSIVYCSLAVALEHSGVYVGDGSIVHRDGNGYLALVSSGEFISRIDGYNDAISIYVSCRRENPVGSEEVARRALECLRDPKHPEHNGYDILLKNCHQFCQYCLTGKEQGAAQCTFFSLSRRLNTIYHMDNWRVWSMREERERIEAECREAIRRNIEVRAGMEKAILKYLTDHMTTFDSAFEQMKKSLTIGDVEGFMTGINTITRKLNGAAQFETMDEFDSLMKSDEPLKL
jgi:hypothetical protein